MSDLPQRILVQLDPGPYASSFDSIVAIDAAADRLLTYSHVEPSAVQALVHGCLFTRSADQLRHTAIFIGGEDVQQGEALLEQVRQAFMGPLRVSVMLDPNGANTTAVAAVIAAERHLALTDVTALVLPGTGPVGQRIAQLLYRAGARVRIGSRSLERADEVCQRIGRLGGGPQREHALTVPTPVETASLAQRTAALADCSLVICAGAAGVALLPQSVWSEAAGLQVLIDVNAVPPTGAEGVEVTDSGGGRQGKTVYGAIGVGGLKMKLHRGAVRHLFTRNDLVLDAEQLKELAASLNIA